MEAFAARRLESVELQGRVLVESGDACVTDQHGPGNVSQAMFLYNRFLDGLFDVESHPQTPDRPGWKACLKNLRLLDVIQQVEIEEQNGVLRLSERAIRFDPSKADLDASTRESASSCPRFRALALLGRLS